MLSELLKEYLKANIKPEDPGFALLWQIQGYLMASEGMGNKEMEKQKFSYFEFLTELANKYKLIESVEYKQHDEKLITSDDFMNEEGNFAKEVKIKVGNTEDSNTSK